MEIKKFQQLSKIIAFIFAFIMCLLGAMLLIMYVPRVLGWHTPPEFQFKSSGMQLFFAVSHGESDAEAKLASSIIFPLIVAVTMFACYTGFDFFKGLSEGESPFQEQFVVKLKHTGIVLMVFGLLVPLLYSLVLTMVMSRGYYISLDVRSELFVGLILYVIAEVIHYGVCLQEMVDDTV